MTSREFLNTAYAVLVEEFMRPTAAGTPRSLMDALELASPWAEGYIEKDELEALTAGGSVSEQGVVHEPTEEEIVAQNQLAFSWLERRMSNVKGGFSTQ